MSKLTILLIILGILLSSTATAKQIRAVMIDTGYSQANTPSVKICPGGLIDFTGTGIQDDMGHGSNLLGIYERELNGVDYCVYVLKVYAKGHNYSNLIHMQAFLYTLFINDISVINYSSTGKVSSYVEDALVRQLISKGIIFVAAAGNDGKDLDLLCAAYPACVSGVISVGNLNGSKRENSSNYGRKVKAWAQGTQVCAGNHCMTGTSQATAVHSAKLIKKLYLQSLKEK